ncbi:MAG TPA: hypothetical protein VMV52_06500 [Candidatus Nanopelagicaceae bacterium]|nr:hypothetical protein [Candidatus Nanopelagicaceae bacterium]
MPASETILIFVGAPLGLFALIAGIVWAATSPRGGGTSALERPDRV